MLFIYYYLRLPSWISGSLNDFSHSNCFHSLSRFVEQVNTPYEVISNFLPEHGVILYARIFPTLRKKPTR